MKKFLNGKSLMLLTILLFPSLLYVILSTGSHNFIKRPFFGPKTVAENSGDTLFYSVQDIVLENCDGQKIDFTQFRGNLVLCHFVTNDDELEEKRKASQLIALNDRFKEKSDIKIVTFLLNDLNGTCKFNEEYSLISDSWQAYNFKGEYEGLKNQLIFDLPEDITQNKWTNLFVLLDKKGRIRTYRDAIQYVEERALIDDLKILKAEEFIPKKKKKNESE